MGSRTQQAVADRIYEDFEPFYEWDRDQRLVNVMLPGYRRDQLKVQVTSKRILRILGERQIFENRWRRFNLELPLLSDYDTDNVSAKFEGGTLSVKFGKLLKPEKTTTPPTQKVEQQKPPQQVEEAKKTNAEVSDQKKEETKTETAEEVSEEAKTNNGSSETKEAAATTPQAPPTTKSGKVARSKTRLIDFTLSLGSNRDAIGDSDAGKNKYKKMVKWMLIIYLVLALVGLGFYYARNELTLFPGESDIESYFQEL